MKKRAAMTIAAGLVVVMLAGAATISLGLAGGTPVQADSESVTAPIVRTIRETVTVHRRADGEPARTVQVLTAPAPASTTPSSVTMDDDSYANDDDSYGEDSYEDGEHEDQDGSYGDDSHEGGEHEDD